MSPVDDWTVTMRGDGRVRGLVVTGIAESIFDTQTYFTVASGHCHTAGCDATIRHEGRGASAFAIGKGSTEFKRGTYRLFVIADAAEVTVEIEIEGLRGSSVLTPTEPAVADVDSFRYHPVSTPDGTVWAGGGFSDLAGPSRGFALLEVLGWRDGPEPRPVVFDTCVYDERDHAAPDHAFFPGCPGADDPRPPVASVAHAYGAWVTRFDELPAGIGGYSVAPLPDGAGGFGLWMPLTEALP